MRLLFNTFFGASGPEPCAKRGGARLSFLSRGLLLGAAAALVACGGGGGGAGSSEPSLSIQGPTRAVANTLYSYEAQVNNGTGADFNWAWGDGSSASQGSPVGKVWHSVGEPKMQATASVNGTALTSSQSIAVVGKPVSTGFDHSCALSASGGLYCWGNNNVGQLGIGSTGGFHSTPQIVEALNALGPVDVGTGNQYSCALLISGQVRCWGANAFGQLGNGFMQNNDAPFQVVLSGGQLLTGIRALSVGPVHSCGVTDANTVNCWGRNSVGQLGDGSVVDREYAVLVNNVSDVVAVSAGEAHTCALMRSGNVKCWGEGDLGQLGHGVFADSTAPVDVSGLNDAVAISTRSDFTCALRANGQVVCWGLNNQGQLGDGNGGVGIASNVPVTVGGASVLIGVSAISAGSAHACALLQTGNLMCWGYNSLGQLGIDNHLAQTTPVSVLNLAGAISVSAGVAHTCALQATPTGNGNTAYCWGSGGNGRLGAGGTDPALTPQPVFGGAASFWK